MRVGQRRQLALELAERAQVLLEIDGAPRGVEHQLLVGRAAHHVAIELGGARLLAAPQIAAAPA